MEDVLEHLCGLFDEELERQQNVLAVCRAQHEAILSRDRERLEAKTLALQFLVRDAAEAEPVRHEAQREVVAHYGLPVERQSLTELIQVVPEPWRSRMAGFQTSLRATVAETHAMTRENTRALKRSRSIVQGCLSVLGVCLERSAGDYNARGREPFEPGLSPALVDQRG